MKKYTVWLRAYRKKSYFFYSLNRGDERGDYEAIRRVTIIQRI